MRGARDPIERGVRLLCAPFGEDALRERGDDSRPQAQSIRLMCDCALKIRVESQVQINGLLERRRPSFPPPSEDPVQQVNSLAMHLSC